MVAPAAAKQPSLCSSVRIRGKLKNIAQMRPKYNALQGQQPSAQGNTLGPWEIKRHVALAPLRSSQIRANPCHPWDFLKKRCASPAAKQPYP